MTSWGLGYLLSHQFFTSNIQRVAVIHLPFSLFHKFAKE